MVLHLLKHKLVLGITCPLMQCCPMWHPDVCKWSVGQEADLFRRLHPVSIDKVYHQQHGKRRLYALAIGHAKVTLLCSSYIVSVTSAWLLGWIDMVMMLCDLHQGSYSMNQSINSARVSPECYKRDMSDQNVVNAVSLLILSDNKKHWQLRGAILATEHLSAGPRYTANAAARPSSV